MYKVDTSVPHITEALVHGFPNQNDLSLWRNFNDSKYHRVFYVKFYLFRMEFMEIIGSHNSDKQMMDLILFLLQYLKFQRLE